MGFEAFRIELRGGKLDDSEADETVRGVQHIDLDPQSIPTAGSKFFVFDDGRHVIELELMDSPTRLSCRFTLCHPPSVDSVFFGLVRELMVRLGMDARICDDMPPEHSRPFTLSEFAQFSSVASRCIAARGKEWIAAFGDQSLAATTKEVHRRIILPRCEPRIEQPT